MTIIPEYFQWHETKKQKRIPALFNNLQKNDNSSMQTKW